MAINRDDIKRGLRDVGLDERDHVLVHASYRSLGGVDGGPPAVVDALAERVATVVMPAFTWERTSVWDASGVFPGNAYAPTPPLERTAVPFTVDVPIDADIGIIAETFRRAHRVTRSNHPLQSFVASGPLASTIAEGDDQFLEPIERLADAGGVLLLLGVTHTSSTAIHLAEHEAGRRAFLRHALTTDGVTAVSCAGCSASFDDLEPFVRRLERRTVTGAAVIRAYDLREYVDCAKDLIREQPEALLCDCDRCKAIRAAIT